ncbi:hypothetical protein [Rubrivirga marina]|uniref:Spondin domain-containing protein n=1 Tax=Rubrivirga marina TaxID=1196024 RepID=A0A271J2T6_9BACT|nr:hypothetical protein [Rubrivirga marina]PAP77812.1 hypothetical protein BSZ37_15845 [Rubrivirga marina]
MRTLLSLAGPLLMLGLLLGGCDSVGLDDAGPCPSCATDSEPSGDPTGPDGGNDGTGDDGADGDSNDGSTGGSDDDSGGEADDGSGPGGSTDDFIPVDPRQTYTLTWKDDAIDAPAVRLADYGVAPGDVVCGQAVGDFYTEPGVLASSRGYPQMTAIFSSDASLLPSDQRVRVKGAVDTADDVPTLATAIDGLDTDVAEDFDATSGCVTVPDGARYVFLAPYDAYYGDNTDAHPSGQPFGLLLKK